MKKSKWLVSLCATLMMFSLLVPSISAAPKEYIPDPSLNSATKVINPWELVPGGTEWAGWANNVSLHPDDKVTLDGADNKYFTLHNNAFNSTATIISPAIKLEKGKKYTLTCKIKYENLKPDIGKTDGVKKGVSIGFIGSAPGTGNDEGKLLLQSGTEGTFIGTEYKGTSNGWEKFKGVIEIPASQTMTAFHLKLRCWASEGTVSFDDISLKEYVAGDDKATAAPTTTTTIVSKATQAPVQTTDAPNTSSSIATTLTGSAGTTTASTQTPAPASGNNLWIIWVVVVIAVVVLGGGAAIYFFVIRKKPDSSTK